MLSGSVHPYHSEGNWWRSVGWLRWVGPWLPGTAVCKYWEQERSYFVLHSQMASVISDQDSLVHCPLCPLWEENKVKQKAISETRICWMSISPQKKKHIHHPQHNLPRTETEHLADPWITFVGSVRAMSSEITLPVNRTEWISTEY